MVKQSFSSEHDRNDIKEFKESLGTFGTTTKPGGNQLQELQTKIRQGVKHVELHLASTSKGQFGVQDVPDKYGFEQRRTIMQLAKLNKQSLSVHGTFDVTSFSGLNQNTGSFDDNLRYNAIKEIDETIKFAAETAKSGAVVFHIQGDGLSTDKGELNLSKSYLDWLKKNKPDEYKELEKNYFTSNPLDRQFVSDPDKIIDIKEEFRKLKSKNSTLYNNYMTKTNSFDEAWRNYYNDRQEDKRKLSPDIQPLVVIGDKMGSVDRKQELINLDNLKNPNNFSDKEKIILNQLDIDLDHFDINNLQKVQNLFSNGIPKQIENKLDKVQYKKLKSKILITYEIY